MLDADQQLGDRLGDHALDEEGIGGDAGGMPGDRRRDGLDGRDDRTGTAEPEADGAGLGLVRQIGADQLDGDRITERVGRGGRVSRAGQASVGHRDAGRRDALFAVPFVEQREGAIQRGHRRKTQAFGVFRRP